MFAKFVSAVFILHLSMAAHAGIIVTREGAAYTGPIEVKAGDQLGITPKGAAGILIPMKDVARVTLVDAAPTTATAPTATELIGPWKHTDLGTVHLPGDANHNDNGFVLHGSGWGIWGGRDSAHFVFRPVDGDVDMIVHVGDFPANAVPFQAALALRNSLEADSPQAAVSLAFTGSPHLNARPLENPRSLTTPRGKEPLHWLRLVRSADSVSAFCSANGQDWLPCGTTHDSALQRNVLAGITVAATADTALATAAFDHLSMITVPIGPGRGICLTDGTRLAGKITAFDDKGIQYLDPAGASHTLPAASVAYLFTRPLMADVRKLAPADKTGLFLDGGDLMEGEVQSFANDHFTVSSLVLGVTTPSIDNVIMAILAPVNVQSAMTLTLRDGSTYRTPTVTAVDGKFELETKLLGKLIFPAKDVLELRAEN